MLNKVASVDKDLEKEYLANNYSDVQMPGDEMRKLKGLYKKIVEKEKKEEFKRKLISRETEEAKVALNCSYELIYPHTTYQ